MPRLPSRSHLPWLPLWALTLALASIIPLRWIWHDGLWPLLLLNMFTLYVFVPAYPVAVVACTRKRWPLAALASILCLWHLTWVLGPLLPNDPPAARGDSLTVISANLLMVHPDPDALATELEAHDADILVLQEYSPRWEAAAIRRGWFEQYPYQAGVVRTDSFGCAIFSRVPLQDVEVVSMAGLPQLQATIELGGVEVDLLNVHTLPPRIASYVPGHHEGTRDILQWVDTREDRPFVVTGDFNSTPYSRFDRLMGARADDAWNLAGRGYGHTATNGVFPIPPIRLDHVYLSRDLTVEAITMGEGVGSDHRPLIVDLAMRN